MPKYVVGFDIADCRSLELEEGLICADVFLIVECCGKKWQSDVKEEQNPGFMAWNQKKIWSDIELLEEEFRTAYIEFAVYSRNFFTRNYCIGKATLQLQSVNSRQNHVYAKKCIPLIKEGVTQAAGVMTLTAFCLKENEPPPTDQQVDDDAQHNLETEELSAAVLGGSTEGLTGEGRPHMIYIDVFKVDKLPDIGVGVTQFPSPFVTVEFAGNLVKTNVGMKVERFNFNTQARIPVMTPVYEDTILIKLWSKNMMGADDLLAQGMISFSQLRNKPLKPTWFCLYGYDPTEITQEMVLNAARNGEHILPNSFKGQLLLSGRVECVETEADLQPAFPGATRTSGEPAQSQRVLLADVYEVCGAVGRECMVELSVAKSKQQTGWVTAAWADGPQSEDEEEEDGPNDEINDEAISFKFNLEKGRVPALAEMMPEDRDSRPKVMLNVYTRGVLSVQNRIGWKMIDLHGIGGYEVGSPTRPVFHALQPMPHNSDQKTPASVLMCLEQHRKENVSRHNRKYVTARPYIVRTYIFMARDIEGTLPQNFGIRVSCAGTSKRSAYKREVRPMWMAAVDMKVSLNSDNKDEPPTMEPITVTLCKKGAVGDEDLGKTIVDYQYMREKDTMGNWVPFKLAPQWIRLLGGAHGTIEVAEVLIAFELFQKSALKESNKEFPHPAVPMKMWPSEMKEYQKEKDFCTLRQATVHFSLLGLRDLQIKTPMLNGIMGYAVPEVEVQVKKFNELAADGKVAKYYTLKFRYQEVIDGGSKRSKEDKLHAWDTDAFGKSGCKNFEFFQAKCINVKLPNMPIIEPFITIKVSIVWEWDNPLTGQREPMAGYWKEGDFVGDHRRCLNDMLPCSWLDGIDPLGDHTPEIEKKIEALRKQSAAFTEARGAFEEETEGQRRIRVAEERQKNFEAAQAAQKASGKKSVVKEATQEKDTGPDGLPPQFHEFDIKTNPVGIPPDAKEATKLKVCRLFKREVYDSLNYTQSTMFSPRMGELQKKGAVASISDTIMGKYENKQKNKECDFYFLGQPLLRDHDIIDVNEERKHDWLFDGNNCYGFVKYVFKITDGWEGPMELDDHDGSGVNAGVGEDEDQGGLLKQIEAQFKKWGGGAKADAAATTEIVEAGSADFNWDEVLANAEKVTDPTMKPEPHEMKLLDLDVVFKAKLEMLKPHCEELYGILTEGGKKITSPPSKDEKALQEWLKKVQQRFLEPWRPNAVQKELEKIMKEIAEFEELEPGSGNSALRTQFITKFEAIAIKINERLRQTEEPVTYADFMRKEFRAPVVELTKKVGYCKEKERGISQHLEDARKRMRDLEWLATSFGFDRTLDKWAFDNKKFFEHYRKAPNRIRCRFYFVKAICILAKEGGSPDPYWKVSIRGEETSSRNDPCWGTNEPEFYRTEERDIELPHGGRALIELKDFSDVPVGALVGKQDMSDTLMGSTIIDLEDRWHSKALQDAIYAKSVPRESRPLTVVQGSGKQVVTGSLLMWVEMIDSTEAADKKATPLSRPPAMEVEIRFVIWTCHNVKLVDNGKCDVRVGVKIACEEYAGQYPAAQKTDTHHGSLGDAVFEWRIVFPKVVMPTKSCVIDFTLYDYNLIAGDAPIGNISLDIKKYVEKVASSMDQIVKSSQLQFQSSLDEDEGQNIGEVKFDMMIMPQSEATLKPAGIERSEPNENPQLMTPMEGRGWDSVLPSFAFSLPSFGFYKKVIPLILFTFLLLIGAKYMGLL